MHIKFTLTSQTVVKYIFRQMLIKCLTTMHAIHPLKKDVKYIFQLKQKKTSYPTRSYNNDNGLMFIYIQIIYLHFLQIQNLFIRVLETVKKASLVRFLFLLRSEYKYILYMQTMYVYCVYTATTYANHFLTYIQYDKHIGHFGLIA